MLKINDLHVGIESKQILKGGNLDIQPGEVHVIMGPNGAGKSTLASVIAGNPRYQVHSGMVQLENEDLLEEYEDE